MDLMEKDSYPGTTKTKTKHIVFWIRVLVLSSPDVP